MWGRERDLEKIPEPHCLINKVGLVITYMPICKHLNHILMSLLVVKSSISSVTRRIQLFMTPWTAACQASLLITNSWSLLKLMSIELAMPSNHLTLCHPLLLPSIFPSIRVFCKILDLMKS